MTEPAQSQLEEAVAKLCALDNNFEAQSAEFQGQRIGDRMASLINLVTQIGGTQGIGTVINLITLLTKVLAIYKGPGTTAEKIAAIYEILKGLLGGDTAPAPAAMEAKKK